MLTPVFSLYYKGTLVSVREVLKFPYTRQHPAPANWKRSKKGNNLSTCDEGLLGVLSIVPLKSPWSHLPPTRAGPGSVLCCAWPYLLRPEVTASHLCNLWNGYIVKKNRLTQVQIPQENRLQSEKHDPTVKAAERNSQGYCDRLSFSFGWPCPWQCNPLSSYHFVLKTNM